jgi:hypothetical protein
LRQKIIILAIVVILFGSIQSAAAIENITFDKKEFSIEYPSNWKVKDYWNKFQNEVTFQSDLRSGSGMTIKHQKSITPISTINNELIQFLIENERENCRINKNGPCWNFEFTNAKTTTMDGTQAIFLQFDATIKDKKLIVKKIFLPDGDYNWLITIKVTKDKKELLEEIEKSLETFSRNNEMVNQVNFSNLENTKIPKWVKDTMKWYVEGQISEDEMIIVLEFLINQNVIKISNTE